MFHILVAGQMRTREPKSEIGKSLFHQVFISAVLLGNKLNVALEGA